VTDTHLSTGKLGSLASDLGVKAIGKRHDKVVLEEVSQEFFTSQGVPTMLAFLQAMIISSSVISSAGLLAPSKMLKRTVPAYRVYECSRSVHYLRRPSRTHRLLRHEGELVSVARHVEILNVDAVKGDFTDQGVVESFEHLHSGALTTTRGTDKSDICSGWNIDRQVSEHSDARS
jgi:hypothetical protein